MSEQTEIGTAQDLAASIGFDDYRDDPAWIRAESINRNEVDTFGVNGDGDPEDRGTYPRPLATVLTAYHEGEAEGFWTRVAAYLAGMMNVPGFSSENLRTPPAPFSIDTHVDENGDAWATIWLASGRIVQLGPDTIAAYADVRTLDLGTPEVTMSLMLDSGRRVSEWRSLISGLGSAIAEDRELAQRLDVYELGDVDERLGALIPDVEEELIRRSDRVALGIGRAVIGQYREELEAPEDLSFGINGGDLVELVCSAFEDASGDDAERRARDRRLGRVIHHCPECGHHEPIPHWEGRDVARELPIESFAVSCPECGRTRRQLAMSMDPADRRSVIIRALDAACLSVQTDIGQTDGGTAGIFFSGQNETRFAELFDEYLDLELIPDEEEELAAEEDGPNAISDIELDDALQDLIDRGVAEKRGDRYFHIGTDEPLGADAHRGQCGLCRQPLGEEETIEGFGGIAHKRCVDAVGGAALNGEGS